jgi:hypothetical protein
MLLKNQAFLFGASTLILAAATAAQADVIISSDATANMSCSAGICTPMAADAVLNVGDLETLLASGSVTVTTTGSGVQANNVDVATALTWSSAATLTLDAYASLSIAKSVSVAGEGGLSLLTNDGGTGGTLSFGDKGNASFANLSSALTINGTPYTLLNSIKALADAVHSNPAGDYAFAAAYDASGDGTYTSSPVPTTLTGTVEGLGNVISNLSISVTDEKAIIGLFSQASEGAVLNDIRLKDIRVDARGQEDLAGGVAGESTASLSGDTSSGTIKVGKLGVAGGLVGNVLSGTITGSHASVRVAGGVSSTTGGLVGEVGQGGIITNSYASGKVSSSGEASIAGGLAGGNSGQISGSFATGAVKVGCQQSVGTDEFSGGLVGTVNQGSVSNSFATGAVTGNCRGAMAGGLFGFDGYGGAYGGSVEASYSTGAVGGDQGEYLGGFAGYVLNDGAATDNYWDITTSGTDQGAGFGPSAGITGLKDKKFRSGLPAGFSSSIWGQKRNVNNGLPYLLANPPPK